MRNRLPAEELARRLAETAPALQALAAGQSLEVLRFRPAADEWSAAEVICHLRDVDREVHLPRLQSLIGQEEPFMPGVVSDDWVKERDYQAQDPLAALAALHRSRAELLALLPPAGDPIWERRGRHTFFGPTSFWELVCLVLEHDELHVTQVRETLAAASERAMAA